MPKNEAWRCANPKCEQPECKPWDQQFTSVRYTGPVCSECWYNRPLLEVVNTRSHEEWRDDSNHFRRPHRWLFWLGTFGTVVLVYEHSLEDALEEAASWAADHAPGIFTEPEYAEAMEEHDELAYLPGGFTTLHQFLRERPQERYQEVSWEDWFCKVTEQAEADLTYTESGYIASWEWNIEEDPTRERLLELVSKDRESRKWQREYGRTQ